MKDSRQEKPIDENGKKHNLRIVRRNDNPKPDGVPCIMIGKLVSHSNKMIPLIKNLRWLDENVKDESNG